MTQALCSQVVSSCLVRGLGDLAEEYCLLECKSQAEGAAHSVGSGSLGFHVRGLFPAVSKN